MTNATKLEAWKRNEGGASISPCPLEDSDAIEFRLSYLSTAINGRAEGQQSFMTFKSKTLAEDVQRAVEQAFEAGKRAAKADLRAWLQP